MGARVSSRNPNPSDYDDSLPEPDSTWKCVHIQFRHKNGSLIESQMLRPAEWVEHYRLTVGGDVFLRHTEIETRGSGRVIAIEDCPPIADGDGAVVISRIKTHLAGNLFEIAFENGETLTGTGNHPVWSVDRHDWVPLGEFRPGEYVESRDGSLQVIRVTPLHELQPVYNIEVHGEHVYHVTASGVLVHNNTADDCARLVALRLKIGEGLASADEIAEATALEKKLADGILVAPNRVPSIRTGKWGQGSFGSAAESLGEHFAKHGPAVGAKDIDQYLRKAEAFADNLRGATKSAVEGATQGVTRYKKLGKYIDIYTDADGNRRIISFGAQ